MRRVSFRWMTSTYDSAMPSTGWYTVQCDVLSRNSGPPCNGSASSGFNHVPFTPT